MNNFRVGRWLKSDEGRPRIEVMEAETYVATIWEIQDGPGTCWSISGARDMADGKKYSCEEEALDNLWESWKTSPRRVRAGLHEDAAPKDIRHDIRKLTQTGHSEFKLLSSYRVTRSPTTGM